MDNISQLELDLQDYLNETASPVIQKIQEGGVDAVNGHFKRGGNRIRTWSQYFDKPPYSPESIEMSSLAEGFNEIPVHIPQSLTNYFIALYKPTKRTVPDWVINKLKAETGEKYG